VEESLNIRNRVLSETWNSRLVILGLSLFGLLVVYHNTLISMIDIWWRSETFAHGFIIFPTTVFLVWRVRKQIILIQPETGWSGAIIMLISGFVWLLANISDVLVAQQFAFISMMIGMIWYLLGIKIIKALAFPVLFLYFSVPAGESLIPSLIDFTAEFTVQAVRLTGVPVFSEGNFISLPSGNWSVVKACSGIRYLIASIVLGFLYAYLNYRSISKRIIFIVFSIIVPVLANGIRAFMIVMIGHYSDMSMAVGVDHLIYGWLFFGLVIFIMFWVGSYWADKPLENREVEDVSGEYHNIKIFPHMVYLVSVCLLLTTVWPLWAYWAENDSTGDQGDKFIFSMPDNVQGWSENTSGRIEWEPYYINPTATYRLEYISEMGKAGAFIIYYNKQKQGTELINSQNKVVHSKDPVWSVFRQQKVSVPVGGYNKTIEEWRLRSASKNLLVWRIYLIDDSLIYNRYYAKLTEALKRIFSDKISVAAVLLYTPYYENEEQSRNVLQNYMNTMLPGIHSRLIMAENNE
jgi:exosortase A